MARTITVTMFLLGAGVLLILGMSFIQKEDPLLVESTHTILYLGDTKVTAELAVSAEERRRGLSGRESLNDGEGMLFVFEDADFHGIWMKDMNFPIDILWIGEDLNVLDQRASVSPDSYPEVFRPKSEALYVLELSAGFSDAHGVKIGTLMRFETPLSKSQEY